MTAGQEGWAVEGRKGEGKGADQGLGERGGVEGQGESTS